MHLSACIEMLFVPETQDFAERIRLAKSSGLSGFEFWRWTNKDLDAIERAKAETGLVLTAIVAEPMIPLTDPARHAEFLEGLKRSLDVARRLGTGVMIAQAGDDLPGRTRAEQRAALTQCLSRTAEILEGSGVVLAVEPLNTRVDHKGYYLDSTTEGLDIIDDVGRPEIRILYDLYHSMVMDEVPEDVLAGRLDRVAHIHVADHPGRNQPGSGRLPLKRVLDWLEGQGYAGMAGVEFRPTSSTAQALTETFAALGSPRNARA